MTKYILIALVVGLSAPVFATTTCRAELVFNESSSYVLLTNVNQNHGVVLEDCVSAFIEAEGKALVMKKPVPVHLQILTSRSEAADVVKQVLVRVTASEVQITAVDHMQVLINASVK